MLIINELAPSQSNIIVSRFFTMQGVKECLKATTRLPKFNLQRINTETRY